MCPAVQAPLHPPGHKEHAGELQRAQHHCGPHPATPPPSLGRGQLGVPAGSPQPSTSSLTPRYLPRSPPRRTPAAAGLQPWHGPAALPAAPGTDASPAASGKGSPCPALPGAQLPSPCSARPRLPCAQRPGLCFHSRAFPRASGHGGGGTGQRTPWHRAGRCVPGLAGRLGRTGHAPSAAPAVAARDTALTLAQLCQGLAGGPKTSTGAEKVTGLDPVGCSVRCQVLPSLYPRKMLGRQVGAREPPQPLFCSREDAGAHGHGDGPTSTAGQGELGPHRAGEPQAQPSEQQEKGQLGGELGPKPSAVAWQGKFLPSGMGQRPCHGPVLPETLSPAPASSTEPKRAVAAGAPRAWPHPQPCLGALRVHRAQTCLGNT